MLSLKKASLRSPSARIAVAAAGALLISFVGMSVATAPAFACSCGAPGYLWGTTNLATVNKPVPVNVLPMAKLWSLRDGPIDVSTVVRLESSSGSEVTGKWTRVNDGWYRFRPDGMLTPGNYRLVHSYCIEADPADCPAKPDSQILEEFQVGTEIDNTPPNFSGVSVSCEFITCRNGDSCCDERTQHWDVNFSDDIRRDGEYVRATISGADLGARVTEVVSNVLSIAPWNSCQVEHGFNGTVPTGPIRMTLSMVDLAGNETPLDGELVVDLSGRCTVTAPPSIRIFSRADAGVSVDASSPADGGAGMGDGGLARSPDANLSSSGCSYFSKDPSSSTPFWSFILLATIVGKRARRRARA